jgi:FixJ family two-component response regulator
MGNTQRARWNEFPPGAVREPVDEALKPKVFIVDDDPAMRESLCFLVGSVGLEVAAFSAAQEFLDRYDPRHPGCLVLDIRMPGMSGLELQDRLLESGIRIPIVMVTGFGDVPMAVRAMKRGAIGFIEKPFTDQDLLDRVNEALVADREWRVARAKREDLEARVAKLTPRERQVMDFVLAGKPNKLIAGELGLSPKTIEVHRARMMEKMQVRSLAELLQLVIKTPHADA